MPECKQVKTGKCDQLSHRSWNILTFTQCHGNLELCTCSMNQSQSFPHPRYVCHMHLSPGALAKGIPACRSILLLSSAAASFSGNLPCERSNQASECKRILVICSGARGQVQFTALGPQSKGSTWASRSFSCRAFASSASKDSDL